MAEVGRLFEMDGGISASKSDIYEFYRVLLKDLVEERVSFLSSKCEDVRHHFEKEKEEGKEDADINAAYQVALLAFRLAVRSAIDQTLAKAMITSLGPSSFMDNHFLWKAGKEEENAGHPPRRFWHSSSVSFRKQACICATKTACRSERGK